MTNKQPLGRWALRVPLFVLVLSACSSLPLNPDDDEWVAQRIARHPEPWIIDPKEVKDAYAEKYLERRYFFLKRDSLSTSSSVDDRSPTNCSASERAGEKTFSLCAVRDKTGSRVHALKLRSDTTTRNFQVDAVQKNWIAQQVQVVWTEKQLNSPVESCNEWASGSGLDANFFSYDAKEEMCLAVTIGAIKKSTIERDRLFIHLRSIKRGPITAAVASGGPRPM